MKPARAYSEQRYDCLSCGKGCKMPWKIKVKPERIPGIQLTSRFQQVQKEGYTPLPVMNGMRQVGRREDASCVFLVDDLCAIHSELGFKAKPQICQLFPFCLSGRPRKSGAASRGAHPFGRREPERGCPAAYA